MWETISLLLCLSTGCRSSAWILVRQASKPLLYPLNWLFAKLFWRAYMRQALERIRKLIQAEEPCLYR
jgi:hypothetical protein